MKVLLLDTEKTTPQIIDTEGGLASWYKLLKCDRIDIQSLQVTGQYYDFICDDEALFKERAKPTALNQDKEPVLVGNIIICRADEEGHEATLTDADIKELLKHIVILTEKTEEKPEQWLAIFGAEY